MFSYDAPCQIPDCALVARGEDSLCLACCRYVCRQHYEHECYTLSEDPEAAGFYRNPSDTIEELDRDELQKEIAALRPGETWDLTSTLRDCSIREDNGGPNIHIPIVFKDGCEWLLRLPVFRSPPKPSNICALIRTSEVLTYQTLHSAGVLVPEVYSWGLGSLSENRHPFFTHIIYSKLPGAPVWDLDGLSMDQLDRFIDTYAAQSIKISNVRFEAIGGLQLNDAKETVIGKLVDVRETNGPDCADLGGPFSSTREKYLYQLDASIAAIKAGQLFRWAPLRAYLAYCEVKKLVLSCRELKEVEDGFYLRHPDATSDNVLILENGEVSGLLDWEWAQTTSKTAAFGAPRWALSSEFWKGKMEESEVEGKLCSAYERHGRPDLADCVRNGRVHQLLDSFMGTDLYSRNALGEFLPFFRAMITVLDPESKVELPESVIDWEIATRIAHDLDEDMDVIDELDAIALTIAIEPTDDDSTAGVAQAG